MLHFCREHDTVECVVHGCLRVAPEDGLLAQLKSDGTYNIVFSTQAGETDLQGLAKIYDSNKDGVLDHYEMQEEGDDKVETAVTKNGGVVAKKNKKLIARNGSIVRSLKNL